MIEKEEIDRETTSLWPVHTDVWEGFVFVNLSREEPRPLLEHLADQQDEPLGLARFGLAELRIGHISTVDVQANWKIVLENYNECLHCPTIHPELVAVVPAYKKGSIFEDGREDGGVIAGRRAHRDRRRPAAAAAAAAGLQGPASGTRSRTTARGSTRRCSSTSTARPAWRPRSSRPGRGAAGW